jgi:hypothetical protein
MAAVLKWLVEAMAVMLALTLLISMIFKLFMVAFSQQPGHRP